jgi:conjugative transfer signal peptidase TraF
MHGISNQFPACKVLLVILAALLPFYGVFYVGCRINLTSSEPMGLYRITSTSTIQRSQMVSICLDDAEFIQLARERGYLLAGSCESGLRPLLKHVAGLPGDFVSAGGGMLTINGQVLPNTARRAVDSRGRPVPSRLKDGVIPPGMALILASDNNSFDGRYFGLVPIEKLQPVKPLLTF